MYSRALHIKETAKGFTLVETLVAIAILLLVIIGPITVAQKGIQNARYSNEQFTAVFLAQEAIEAVQELRDQVALAAYKQNGGGDTWNWLSSQGVCADGYGCAFIKGETGPNQFVSCTATAANSCILKVDGDGNYSNTGTADSPFTRTVTIGSLVGGVFTPVTVTVSWSSQVFNGVTRDIKLQTYLYNHYQRYGN